MTSSHEQPVRIYFSSRCIRQRDVELHLLFGEFISWTPRALWAISTWQTPIVTLPLKWQQPQAAKGEFILLPVSWHADGDFILRYVATQSAVEFVPPAKNRAPVGIRLTLNN